jgi:diguanylate cyclase (GGDEF)-like protein
MDFSTNRNLAELPATMRSVDIASSKPPPKHTPRTEATVVAGRAMRAALRWFRQFDQYYWLTAFLAARGAQKSTCRLIAMMVFGLGAIPVILIGSSVGPQTPRDRLLAVFIALSCLLMALRWLGRRWPTRTESILCIITGTVCVAVACVITPNPVVGLFGATSFTVLSAYTVVFHTARLLLFTWTAGAAVLGLLAVRVAEQDRALALGSVILVVLLNVFLAFAGRVVIRLTRSNTLPDEMEPLTGLLNRHAFYAKATTLLASRSRDDDRYFVVAVINIDSYSALVGIGGSPAGDRARVNVGRTLRETIRHNAVLAHVAGAEFLIADSFTAADTSPLVERVRAAVAATPSHVTAGIGAVSTPLRPLTACAPNDVLDELIAIATSAMYAARRNGGNQASYVVTPPLTTLDRSDGADGYQA